MKNREKILEYYVSAPITLMHKGITAHFGAALNLGPPFFSLDMAKKHHQSKQGIIKDMSINISTSCFEASNLAASTFSIASYCHKKS